MTISISQSTLREVVSGLRVLKLPRQKLVFRRYVRITALEAGLTFEASTHEEHVAHISPSREFHASARRVLLPYELLDRVARSADNGSEVSVCPGCPGVIAYRSSGMSLELPFDPLDADQYIDAPTATDPEVVDLPGGVLTAIHDAMHSAGKDPSRTVIHSVLLTPGEVIATDGRQLYRRNSLNLQLPPAGVALPAQPFLRVLPASAARLAVWIQQTSGNQFATLEAGAWRYTVATISGYPNYRQVIPRMEGYLGPWAFSEEAAEQAVKLLANLPDDGRHEPHVLVHVEGGRMEIRSGGNAPRFSLRIPGTGTADTSTISVACAARYLHNALSRGLRSLYVSGSQHPLVMIDGAVTQLWMPLRDVPETETRQPPRTESPPHLPQSPESREEKQPAATVGIQAAANPVAITRQETRTSDPDTQNTGSLLEVIQRARDAHRLLGVALSSLLPHARELQRQQKALERGHEALKRNLRALRAVEV